MLVAAAPGDARRIGSVIFGEAACDRPAIGGVANRQPRDGAVINFNLTTSVRSAGEVVVHLERVIRDPLTDGI